MDYLEKTVQVLSAPNTSPQPESLTNFVRRLDSEECYYFLKSMWCDCTNISPPASPSAKAGPQTSRNHFGRRMKIWYKWVAEFSRRSLSKPTDKLPAIAGLAAKLLAVLGWTYAAGLWTRDLHTGLIWSAVIPKSLVRHKTPLRAPSWSWASVDGDVQYPLWSRSSRRNPGYDWPTQVNEGEDLQILDVVVDEHFPGRFGTVSRGRLEAVATMYALATVPWLDGSRFGFRYSSRHLHITLDEPLAGHLESGDSSGTSNPQPSSYWIARVCSKSCYWSPSGWDDESSWSEGLDDGEDFDFYLALKQNDAAAEEDSPSFSRIGIVRQEKSNDWEITLSGGILKRVTIL
ncbi:hypothetical protein QBC37DRAFT_401418 [Rhypophila decipiens]|uniref:Uncharacterized protein n=1 Tax=Rhypophila decipiens TaxID=261697 RepID=A0AAN6Y4T0_9PEZI|nr:hypothetical protein QBC37DRAFT_401418 [Rhypophila decipiens]